MKRISHTIAVCAVLIIFSQARLVNVTGGHHVFRHLRLRTPGGTPAFRHAETHVKTIKMAFLK